jgi:hypothetical protein
MTTVMLGACELEYHGPEFENDKVTVIIERDHMFREFNVKDFKPVKVAEITWVWKTPPDGNVTPEFRPMLNLRLSKPGTKRVLDAVKLVAQKDFVYFAQPVYISIAVPDSIGGLSI